MDTIVISTQKTPRKSQPINKIIGRRIRFLRKINDEDKRMLAERLTEETGRPISESAVRQWEGGYTQPSRYFLIALGEHFDVTSDYIICREFFDLSDEELLALPDKEVCRKPRAPISKEMEQSMKLRGVSMYG